MLKSIEYSYVEEKGSSSEDNNILNAVTSIIKKIDYSIAKELNQTFQKLILLEAAALEEKSTVEWGSEHAQVISSLISFKSSHETTIAQVNEFADLAYLYLIFFLDTYDELCELETHLPAFDEPFDVSEYSDAILVWIETKIKAFIEIYNNFKPIDDNKFLRAFIDGFTEGESFHEEDINAALKSCLEEYKNVIAKEPNSDKRQKLLTLPTTIIKAAHLGLFIIASEFRALEYLKSMISILEKYHLNIMFDWSDKLNTILTRFEAIFTLERIVPVLNAAMDGIYHQLLLFINELQKDDKTGSKHVKSYEQLIKLWGRVHKDVSEFNELRAREFDSDWINDNLAFLTKSLKHHSKTETLLNLLKASNTSTILFIFKSRNNITRLIDLFFNLLNFLPRLYLNYFVEQYKILPDELKQQLIIHDAGYKTMVTRVPQLIAYSTSLSLLKLTNCSLTDETAAPILTALSELTQLIKLDLTANQLTGKSLAAIRLIVSMNSHLSTLKLSHNALGSYQTPSPKGELQHLFRVIETHMAIQKLLIDYNQWHFPDVTFKKLENKAKRSSTLTRIDVTGNNLKKNCKALIAHNALFHSAPEVSMSSIFDKRYMLTRDHWMVAITAKKMDFKKRSFTGKHAMLWIEGIRSFGQVFLLCCDLTAGGLMASADIHVNEYQRSRLAKSLHSGNLLCDYYPVDRVPIGSQLKMDIYAQAKDKESFLRYSSSCFSKAKSHNCLTWIYEVCRQAGVPVSDTKTMRLLPAPSLHLGKFEDSENTELPPRTKRCLMM